MPKLESLYLDHDVDFIDYSSMSNGVCNETRRLERQCGCFPDWVQCDNGRCIPKSTVCDSNPDCQHAGYANDDSDERDCGRTLLQFIMEYSPLGQKVWDGRTDRHADRKTRKNSIADACIVIITLAESFKIFCT